MLQHDESIVKEDNLDTRWEELIEESVDNVIFLSKHTAVTNRPALTIHPIGISFSSPFLCLCYMIFYHSFLKKTLILFLLGFSILCYVTVSKNSWLQIQWIEDKD